MMNIRITSEVVENPHQGGMLPQKLKCHCLEIGPVRWHIYSLANINEALDKWAGQAQGETELQDERFPYWVELWPSAIGLTAFMMENPALVEGKKVLEIGCGLGLCGMTAAWLGAEVVMTDYLPDLLPLLRHSWQQNLGQSPNFRLLDWRQPDASLAAEVLIASDVAYEARNFDPLIQAFERLLLPGGTILLSEPGRAFARPFIEKLHTHFRVQCSVKTIDFHEVYTEVGIYCLKRKTGAGED